MAEESEVVLTPLKGIEQGSHVMRIERIPVSRLNKANVHHFAGGPYEGIIVNKASSEEESVSSKADSVRTFTAYVADPKKDSDDFSREKRELKFWFEELAKVDTQVTEAITDTFFKELMQKENFPKDYINFVKKVLSLVKQYSAIQKLELIMRKLYEGEKDSTLVMNRSVHVQKTVVTTTKVVKMGASQEDYRRLADGTIVDSHGNVISNGSDSMGMEMGGTYMRNGHSQEDYRRLADGTIVDSHGNVVTNVPESMLMSPGSVLSRQQEDHLSQQGFTNAQGVDTSFDATSTAQRGPVKRQPTITRRGWDLIWATKKQKLIQILEDAYPTVMTTEDLVSHSYMKRADVEYLLDDLTKRGLIKDVDKNRFIRIPQEKKLVIRQGTTQRQSRQSVEMDTSKGLDRSMDEETKKRNHEFKMVAHIPHLPAKQQPVIAIVTLLFCEKVAVDAMMDFKTTYIRIKKGEGEGQVYTVGKIGPHIVVSTKLSRIGHGQGAMVAAGNTVTRLLGTFGQLEHVILVGVGGGVPSLSDDTKHVRLGDVVASKVENQSDPVYIHCTDVKQENNTTTFKTETWSPKDLVLEKIMLSLKRKSANQTFFSGEWEKCINEGAEELSGGDTKYTRPPPESDRLYKLENNREVELEHPQSPVGSPRQRDPNKPLLFLGKIGSGKVLSKDDDVRQTFISQTDCMCIDSGFQAVMQSIYGNRKESFAVIRGIADYQDGTHRREWQPYASLVAAAFMKAVILQLSHQSESDEED